MGVRLLALFGLHLVGLCTSTLWVRDLQAHTLQEHLVVGGVIEGDGAGDDGEQLILEAILRVHGVPQVLKRWSVPVNDAKREMPFHEEFTVPWRGSGRPELSQATDPLFQLRFTNLLVAPTLHAPDVASVSRTLHWLLRKAQTMPLGDTLLLIDVIHRTLVETPVEMAIAATGRGSVIAAAMLDLYPRHLQRTILAPQNLTSSPIALFLVDCEQTFESMFLQLEDSVMCGGLVWIMGGGRWRGVPQVRQAVMNAHHTGLWSLYREGEASAALRRHSCSDILVEIAVRDRADNMLDRVEANPRKKSGVPEECLHDPYPLDPARSKLDDPDALVLREELCLLQFGGDGERRFDFHLTGTGLGSTFHFLSFALTFAYESGRILVPVFNNWHYTDPVDCPLQDWGCYFLPVSWCDRKSIANASAEEWSFRNSFSPHVFFNERVYDLNRYTEHVLGKERLDFVNYFVPEPYRHRGTLWWRSQLLNFLLRPHRFVVDAVEKAKRQIGFRHPVIAMHVRHGDKWREAALQPFESYVHEARILRDLYGVSTVFLSTEDEDVITQTRDYPDLTFLMTQNPRRNMDIQTGIADGILNGREEAMIALVNLFISVDCDYFVGTFSSNWSRLVFEMMYARYGVVPPHRSLDWEWIARA